MLQDMVSTLTLIPNEDVNPSRGTLGFLGEIAMGKNRLLKFYVTACPAATYIAFVPFPVLQPVLP